MSMINLGSATFQLYHIVGPISHFMQWFQCHRSAAWLPQSRWKCPNTIRITKKRDTPPNVQTIHYSDVIMGAMAIESPASPLSTQPFIQKQKISKLRVTGLCAGNSPVTSELSAQMASSAENVPIWLRHHAKILHTILGGGEAPVGLTFGGSNTGNQRNLITIQSCMQQ